MVTGVEVVANPQSLFANVSRQERVRQVIICFHAAMVSGIIVLPTKNAIRVVPSPTLRGVKLVANQCLARQRKEFHAYFRLLTKAKLITSVPTKTMVKSFGVQQQQCIQASGDVVKKDANPLYHFANARHQDLVPMVVIDSLVAMVSNVIVQQTMNATPGVAFPTVIGIKAVAKNHLFCVNVILQERVLQVIIDSHVAMV